MGVYPFPKRRCSHPENQTTEELVCVHVVLPCVTSTEYQESMCLGRVWSKAVVDVKTEGDLCGCSSFSFVVTLACCSLGQGILHLTFLWR